MLFTLGKYEFLERLAEGGMGEIYRVRIRGPKGFKKEFALKRILAGGWDDPELVQMFEREARLTSLLDHANIVHVYDFFRAGDSYMLVMEFVKGRDLAHVIKKAGVAQTTAGIAFAAFVVNEMCKGLEYAFRKKDPDTGKELKVLHRDISPENVMISYEGAVKLIDFGIAKAKNGTAITQSSAVFGKLAYLAPERAFGQSNDPRSDIFSTCLVLMELLTGRRVYSIEGSVSERVMQAKLRNIPNPSQWNRSVPAALESIVTKGLARDVEERYQSMGELQRDLQAFLSSFAPSFTQADVATLMHSLFENDTDPSPDTGSPSLTLEPSKAQKETLVSGLTYFEGRDSFFKGATHRAFENLPTHRVPMRVFLANHLEFIVVISLVLLGYASYRFVLRNESPVAAKVTFELPEKKKAERLPTVKEVPRKPTAVAKKKEGVPEVEKLYQEGELLIKQARYEEALEKFRASRAIQMDYLPAWLYELYTLTKLGRDAEARATARLLVQMRPKFKDLPVLQPYLEE